MGLITVKPKKSLVFVGPPSSGKTVFFSTMVDLLIRSEEESSLSCVPKGPKAERFVRSVIESLEKQKWPKEGGAFEADGALTYLLRHKGRLLDCEYELSCCDYAGETFNLAFGDEEKQETDDAEGNAKDLREKVEAADAVFLIVDAVRLHNGNCPEIKDSLFGISEVLKEKKIRTAFVMTQKDEFEFENIDAVIENLKEDYRYVYKMYKQMKAEFFWVASVIAQVDNNGRRVPPSDYKSNEHSIDLLAPINWFLSLPEDN